MTKKKSAEMEQISRRATQVFEDNTSIEMDSVLILFLLSAKKLIARS
jgi:hypothetical protein